MRIKHICTTKEGEPMANPYQEAPQFSAWDMLSPATQTDKLIKEYHSGLLPFEDKKDALDFIPWEYHGYNNTILSQHWDTLIPVDLEVEVVHKCESECPDCEFYDYDSCIENNYTPVLRIKP